MNLIFSQALGSVALIFVCIGYFTKEKSRFLIFQLVSNIFYASSFLFAGAWVGCLTILISTLRCTFLYIAETHMVKHTLCYLFIFIFCYILVGLLFWDTPLDLIPIICAVIFTLSFYIKNLQTMRYCLILPNLLFVIYNLFCFTFANALLDSIEVIAIIISIIKYNKNIYANRIN